MEKKMYELAKEIVKTYEEKLGLHDVSGSLPKYKMGTIEPIYKDEDSKDQRDNIGFIRGVITKYENTQVDKSDIIEYIKRRIG